MPPDDLDDESAQQDRPPRRSPTIRTIAMPADTNPAGDIFGGWLMSQMDLAAGTVAALTARGRSATIAVEGMKFLRPVKVGDEVSLFADLVRVGRSSMHIRVQAWRRQREQEASEKVTQATFTFVALDDDGRARPIDQSGLADSQPEHDQR
ncbi:acyl-CoA thioesterase [Paracoccus sp. R12_1]|uniref:acyl-CoA thioesterase n=1 Tax=unclassified Paracoccus (in: a-proteobacteria) TaxID=2688777 RepID=UPI001ADBA301|nr:MULTISPECIES: acyl-CoA thioesterase [unclassified Paracoccus (in: a-proteobacteria)]MBO9454723.1 acyl-CoA thioesterase [Paracoccus sp. R12_2]MBO9487353.1 acyl-CoA thioesterase [Paracoccus sp. R12_1]